MERFLCKIELYSIHNEISNQTKVIKMRRTEKIISARREDVSQSYNSAVATNRRIYLEGDVKAIAEYIFSIFYKYI